MPTQSLPLNLVTIHPSIRSSTYPPVHLLIQTLFTYVHCRKKIENVGRQKQKLHIIQHLLLWYLMLLFSIITYLITPSLSDFPG